jgi:cytochrome c biogenesis protein
MVSGAVAAALVVAFLVTRPIGSSGPVPSIDPNAFYRVAAEQEGLQVGQRAPDFVGRVNDQEVRLTDIDGRQLSISAFRGRPLWINFWATWCPPCQRETPDLRAAYEAHRREGLVLVAISIQEPADIVREYVTRYGLTYTIGLDVSAAIMRTYGVYGLPTHYFVDRDGVIRDRWYGPLSRAQIEERLSVHHSKPSPIHSLKLPRQRVPFVLRALWSLLTSMRLAVVQIVVLVVASLDGILVRQIPSYVLHNIGAYQREIADLHARYDGLSILAWRFGPMLVDVFERVGLFRVFSASWFLTLATILAISLTANTLDRLPKLWRDVRRVRVVQPDRFFDERLSNRAVLPGVGLGEEPHVAAGAVTGHAVSEVFRGRGYRVREVQHGGRHYIYGDRNAYHKLMTLPTHAAVVLFLVAGAVTGTFGYETVVFVADGQSAPVQALGTQDNLIVRSLGFYAPRNPDGSFADFYSVIVVYRNGVEVASKRIRVNDPLEVDGFLFHQNTFGPALDLEIHDEAGALLWQGPFILDGQTLGKPSGTMFIPGSDTGLLAVLDRKTDGSYGVALVGVRTIPNTGQSSEVLFGLELPPGVASSPEDAGGYRISWSKVSGFTGMVVKKDPGQPLVVVAFAALIGGLVLTFYFPRRRVWSVLERGQVRLAVRCDRYVNEANELAALIEGIRRRMRAEVIQPTGVIPAPTTAR